MSTLVRATVIISLLAAAGCGDMMGEGAADECDPMTLQFDVTPLVVTRGEAVDIVVTWQTAYPLVAPIEASLLAGSRYDIEVEVPLAWVEGAEGGQYVGTQLNPFGAGAPAGSVSVLAQAAIPEGCTQAPSATSSFTLQ